MNRFGQALKQLRQRMGLRQNDLAAMVGVERSTVANWERGAKQPSLDMVMRLSEVLGVSLDELVGAPRAADSLPPPCHRALASDPVVRLLAERTGVPAKTIAAFIAALQAPDGNCCNDRQPKRR